MKKRIGMVVAVLAALVALAACAQVPSHGVVTDKSWIPGHVNLFPCGKNRLCPMYVPPVYSLDVKDDAGAVYGFNVNGRVWSNCQVNDTWIADSKGENGYCTT